MSVSFVNTQQYCKTIIGMLKHMIGQELMIGLTTKPLLGFFYKYPNCWEHIGFIALHGSLH